MSLSLGKTSLKSALLSSSVFWILMSVDEGFEPYFIFLWIITVFITAFLSLVMIAITILPFYEYRSNLSKSSFFHTYFPYYAVVFFGVSVWILYHNYEEFLLYVLIAANVSAMMSWVWLFREEVKE